MGTGNKPDEIDIAGSRQAMAAGDGGRQLSGLARRGRVCLGTRKRVTKAGWTLFHDKGSDMDHLLDIFEAEGDTLFLELRGPESGLECEL